MLQERIVSPIVNPLTGVFGLLMFAMLAVPWTTVHTPTAGGVGTFPCRKVWSSGLQSSWSGPASAGGAFRSNRKTRTMSEVTPDPQCEL